MRKVHCADCGKTYDYDVDDFCPRCGSFNPPPDSGATRLEQELLSRFQRPGTSGQRQNKTASYSYHPTYGSGPDLKRGRTHTASVKSCDACGPEKKKKKSGIKVRVILLVILGIQLHDEVLPTSDLCGMLHPFLADPTLVMAKTTD